MRTPVFFPALLFPGLCALGLNIPQNGIAPNFTLTDINGNTVQLYDMLDQGLVVYLDLSTTWCATCWAIQPQLHAFHDSVGAGSVSNRARVFWVESDPGTDMDDLQGLTAGSMGDWVSTTPFPIVDDPSIANYFGVNGYPTLVAICPDRRMNRVLLGNVLSNLFAALDQCPVATATNDAALMPAMYFHETWSFPPEALTACAGDPVVLQVRLSNLGTSPLIATTIEVLLNGTSIGSTAWTGNLPTYSYETVEVATVSAATSGQLTYLITTADASAVNNTSHNSLTVGATVMPCSSLDIGVVTDGASQYNTSWELLDPTGTSLYAMSAFGISNNQQYTTTIGLADNSCYTFRLSDYVGNGLCCNNGVGSYQLGCSAIPYIQGGAFNGLYWYHPFKTDFTNVIAEHSTTPARIALDASSGLLNVLLERSPGSPVPFRMNDAQGRLVQQGALTDQRSPLSIASLDPGMYSLVLWLGGTPYALRFVKE